MLSTIIVTSIAILTGVIYGAALGYRKAADDNRREHAYMKAVNENLQHRINTLEKEKSLIQEALEDVLQLK